MYGTDFVEFSRFKSFSPNPNCNSNPNPRPRPRPKPNPTTTLTFSLCVLSRSFTSAQWKDVMVGDVLRIHKDQVIPVRWDGWMYDWTETDTQRNCNRRSQRLFYTQEKRRKCEILKMSCCSLSLSLCACECACGVTFSSDLPPFLLLSPSLYPG